MTFRHDALCRASGADESFRDAADLSGQIRSKNDLAGHLEEPGVRVLDAAEALPLTQGLEKDVMQRVLRLLVTPKAVAL
jgi:hypothetical protein